jgi:hypothetical protein
MSAALARCLCGTLCCLACCCYCCLQEVEQMAAAKAYLESQHNKQVVLLLGKHLPAGSSSCAGH